MQTKPLTVRPEGKGTARKAEVAHVAYTRPKPLLPIELQQFGVTERLLQRAFLQCTEEQIGLCWRLDRPVTIGFYRELHKYLRKWPPSRSATKTTVGKFYRLIDSNFQTQRTSSRPDNIYMFVQRLADSSKLYSEPMLYGVVKTVEHLHSVVSDNLEVMSKKVSEHQKSLQEMKVQMEEARAELSSTRRALSDVTNKLQTTIKQRDCAHKQVDKSHKKLEAAIADSDFYEEEILANNEDLSDLVKCLKREISTLSTTSVSVVSDIGDSKFCFQTKDGGQVYTTAVRELYYALLAMQLPPSKIATTIKSVLKSFLPVIVPWFPCDE